MSEAPLREPSKTSLPVSVFVISAGLVLVQLAAGMRYGLFRDELYYLACAERLGWGYVDHPPLSIAILAGVCALLGDSQLAVRLVPALVGSANVLLAAAIARELGGQRLAMGLAALSVAIAPLYLALASFYSMNPLDVSAWALATLCLARILARRDPRSWWWLGLVVGLGLQNKLSMAFFLAGLGLSVAAIPELRRQLTTRAPWQGLAVALLVFAPHLFWQVQHGWPTLEFMHNASTHKNIPLSPLELLLAQIELIHPLNLPLWFGGFLWLAVGAGARFRALGIIWLVVYSVLALQGAKGYYLGPSFALLLPAGAVAFECWVTRLRWSWLRLAAPGLLASAGVAASPLVIPVLPVEHFISYQTALGLTPRPAERSKLGLLPQHFADRFGWLELTESVARVIATLPFEDRAHLLLATSNYGEASALNYFGRAYHLPRAVSTHNSYFLWGPGLAHPRVVIVVGADLSELRELFDDCTARPRTTSPYAMPYESEAPIAVCRGPKMTIEEMWQRGKTFI